MKIGDKYICKRSFYSYPHLMFMKDNIYTITNISDYKDRIVVALGNDHGWSTDFDIIISDGKFNESDYYEYYDFNEYFESLREVRKKKLDRLNESR